MSTDSALPLRRGLYVIAALACLGAAAELILIGHTSSPPQWIPFGLCFLGVGACVSGLISPERSSRLVVGVAVVLALGAAFGVWEHLEHNFEFAREIQPTEATSTWLAQSFTGANPVFAPGVFGLAAIALWLASWRRRAPK